jgi:hypothetical protein
MPDVALLALHDCANITFPFTFLVVFNLYRFHCAVR